MLESAGLLQNGVVTVNSNLPEDEELHGALCDYLFGSPEQVAATAGLPSDATRSAGISWEDLGENGKGLNCFYETSDQIVFRLGLWNKNIFEDQVTSAADLVQVEGDGEYGAASYWSGYEGGTVRDEVLTQWLTEASERFSQTG